MINSETTSRIMNETSSFINNQTENNTQLTQNQEAGPPSTDVQTRNVVPCTLVVVIVLVVLVVIVVIVVFCIVFYLHPKTTTSKIETTVVYMTTVKNKFETTLVNKIENPTTNYPDTQKVSFF